MNMYLKKTVRGLSLVLLLLLPGLAAAQNSGLSFGHVHGAATIFDLPNSNPLATQLVDANGDAITTFGAAGSGTSLADDGDIVIGTTEGTPVMGVYESAPTACTDGDACIVGITADREVKVSVTSGGPTQYNAGTAAGATDKLNAQGCVRDDATTTLSDPDGDYVPCRVNARGAVWVGLETALDKAIDSVAVFGANTTAPIHCTNTAFLNMTTATTTEIVALSGSTIIYVCGYSIVSEGDIVTTVKFVGGTGSNCATSQDDRSSGKILTAGATVGTNFSTGGGSVAVKTSTAGDALCITQSGAANIGIDISYAQF